MYLIQRIIFYILHSELAGVEFSVEAVLCEQLSVCAPLDYRAVVHNQDNIGVADGREPVRNNEARSAVHQRVHRLLDMHFCARVDGACRLVEDETDGFARMARAIVRSWR